MEAALAAEARAADALRRAPPPTTKTPNARRLERLQLIAKYATTLHAGRAKASIVLDDPTIGAGRAALLWSQAPLAGVCDQASTLSQTCLHAARVARGGTAEEARGGPQGRHPSLVNICERHARMQRDYNHGFPQGFPGSEQAYS